MARISFLAQGGFAQRIFNSCQVDLRSWSYFLLSNQDADFIRQPVTHQLSQLDPLRITQVMAISASEENLISNTCWLSMRHSLARVHTV